MKAHYDRIAGGALAVVLVVALTAWCLDLAVESVVWAVGLDMAGPTVDLPAVGRTSWRTLAFGVVELIVVAALWSPLRHLAERARPPTERLARALDRTLRPVRVAAGVARTGAITVLLAFFVLQPHLVMPWQLMPGHWGRRATQLIDGTVSLSFVDAVGWLVRASSAEPVAPVRAVGPDAFLTDLDSAHVPLVDRWDPLLRAAAGDDDELFAMTKAFMWVESGGRQYAVSATGCAGLMQFCASTAQRRPFRSVFGVGAVAPCGCRDCGVEREVQIELETDPEALDRHARSFPCSLSDARFDPERSIVAGTLYVQELSQRVGGHLPLMYVGYNAGPLVADRLYEALGEPDTVTLADLRPHLAPALRPYYGRHADARARGLLTVHLPKLQRAYERFRR